MPDTKTTSEKKKTDEGEDPKATLPVGHPQAGYTSPDLSFHEGRGKLPDEEKEWHEERNQAQQEQAERIAEHEDKTRKEEVEAEAKALEQRTKEEQKKLSQPAGGSTGSASSSNK